MEILKYCKMQICIMLVLFFISYLFIKDGNRLNRKTNKTNCHHMFDVLFILGELAILLDGITSYTVNNLDSVPPLLNMLAHLAYMLIYQGFAFMHFLYWLWNTDFMPKKWLHKVLCYLPICITMLLTIIKIPRIEYNSGEYSNYAMGAPAYACFFSIVLYNTLTLVLFNTRKNYIQQNKRIAFIATLSTICIITLLQIFFNEALVSGIGVILVVISIYLCMENPSIKFLELYHDEMIMGFATLVESKDGSTGGHIHRSSAYAVIIAKELRKTAKYSNIVTKDYIINLNKAAPMHDVGKIGVPDSILQKPAKLTDEEFNVMKKHTVDGGRIIQETFGHLDDDEYENMAYKIATGHHEKWNGKGYPDGLGGVQIPLCARIMAVADVFDAISAKRCYRDAIPLDKCFEIIRNGKGTDFDPDVVDAFFAGQQKVEEVYRSLNYSNMREKVIKGDQT